MEHPLITHLKTKFHENVFLPCKNTKHQDLAISEQKNNRTKKLFRTKKTENMSNKMLFPLFSFYPRHMVIQFNLL
jgi:hypothetical protein